MLAKEAFLILNRERGLLIAGTVKTASKDGKDAPVKSRKVLKREVADAWLQQHAYLVLQLLITNGIKCIAPASQDWAALQADRLRALVVLSIRMARKSPVARILVSRIDYAVCGMVSL